MPKRDAKRLVLAALRSHGPMTDRQLAWWLERLGVRPGTAMKARQKLTEAEEVAWNHTVRTNPQGQLLHVWEARIGGQAATVRKDLE